MEQGQITKQMIEFQKATFNNTFNMMEIMQEQMEKMVNMFLDQSPLVHTEGKQAFNEWLKTYKEGRETFKESVNESYKKVEAYLGKLEKTMNKTKTGK